MVNDISDVNSMLTHFFELLRSRKTPRWFTSKRKPSYTGRKVSRNNLRVLLSVGHSMLCKKGIFIDKKWKKKIIHFPKEQQTRFPRFCNALARLASMFVEERRGPAHAEIYPHANHANNFPESQRGLYSMYRTKDDQEICFGMGNNFNQSSFR